ncbi:MAG: MGMT family protein [Bacteroidales bacterium]|jgi:methylated-DNA-protein-cysteine methyltransferase-like protein|nr:MGMT family protein [Bacteroidales bacterium]MDD3755719.1 MGMT family protein [Bacteroidales bacterium]
MSNDLEELYMKIWELVASIPYGRVTTYGAIATTIGSKASARFVGIALSRCYLAPFYVPAHRVVNRNGLLTGRHHFPGNQMQELLENENVVIIDNQVVNFKELFWDPMIESSDKI